MRDAVSNNSTKKETPSGSVNGSPIIIILALLSIVGIVLFLFKDKIFKKSNNLSDLAEKQKQDEPEPEPEPKQETLTEDEAEKISDKFA